MSLHAYHVSGRAVVDMVEKTRKKPLGETLSKVMKLLHRCDDII